MRIIHWNSVVSRGTAFHAIRRHMRGRYPCRVHTHDFAEVLWIEDGACIHEINGQRAVLEPGSLVMIRPRDRHGFRTTGQDGFCLVNVAFSAETLGFLEERYFPNSKNYFWTANKLPFQTKLSMPQVHAVGAAANRLAGASNQRLAIERFLMDLLDDLAEPVAPGLSDPLPDWLENALQQIRRPEHFTAGTRQLARLAGRCPEHVTRSLKAHLGITATDVVNHAKLDYAALQLKMTPSKIVDVAFECGYQNLGHFYQLFRQRFGISPRHYRLRHQATLR